MISGYSRIHHASYLPMKYMIEKPELHLGGLVYLRGKTTFRNVCFFHNIPISISWKAKCPIFKAIVAGFRGKVA